MRVQDLHDVAHLGKSHERRDIYFDAQSGQALDERDRTLTFGIGDWNLDVDVLPPARDFERLTLHLFELVGENFEGKRLFSNVIQYILAEFAIISHAGFSHKCRICGKPTNPRIRIHLKHASLVGAVRKQLDLQIFHFVHRLANSNMIFDASSRELTRKSTDSGCFSLYP